MKNLIKSFALLTALIISVSACKKDDEKSRTQILIDKSCWKVTKVEGKQNEADPYQDLTAQYNTEPCTADDCFNFASGNVFTLSEGATKCDPGDSDIISAGTWNLSADGNTLTIVAGGETETHKIESFGENKVVAVTSLEGLIVRFTYE